MKIVYVLLATAFFSLSAQAQTNDFLTRHGLSYCESVEQAKKCALNQQQVTTWVAGKKLVGKQTGYE